MKGFCSTCYACLSSEEDWLGRRAPTSAEAAKGGAELATLRIGQCTLVIRFREEPRGPTLLAAGGGIAEGWKVGKFSRTPDLCGVRSRRNPSREKLVRVRVSGR